jgi:hypothetical protein
VAAEDFPTSVRCPVCHREIRVVGRESRIFVDDHTMPEPAAASAMWDFKVPCPLSSVELVARFKR